eukprot:m.16298 g.16298  ORF g.16298 m.16298 type:complete len:532 (+) comp5206_c0_seq2:117-1712(+)
MVKHKHGKLVHVASCLSVLASVVAVHPSKDAENAQPRNVVEQHGDCLQPSQRQKGAHQVASKRKRSQRDWRHKLAQNLLAVVGLGEPNVRFVHVGAQLGFKLLLEFLAVQLACFVVSGNSLIDTRRMRLLQYRGLNVGACWTTELVHLALVVRQLGHHDVEVVDGCGCVKHSRQCRQLAQLKHLQVLLHVIEEAAASDFVAEDTLDNEARVGKNAGDEVLQLGAKAWVNVAQLAVKLLASSHLATRVRHQIASDLLVAAEQMTAQLPKLFVHFLFIVAKHLGFQVFKTAFGTVVVLFFVLPVTDQKHERLKRVDGVLVFVALRLLHHLAKLGKQVHVLENVFADKLGYVVDLVRAEKGVEGKDGCVFAHGSFVVKRALGVEQQDSNLLAAGQRAHKDLAPHPNACRVSLRTRAPVKPIQRRVCILQERLSLVHVPKEKIEQKALALAKRASDGHDDDGEVGDLGGTQDGLKAHLIQRKLFGFVVNTHNLHRARAGQHLRLLFWSFWSRCRCSRSSRWFNSRHCSQSGSLLG